MKKTLVILSDKFGLNYSGGAIATCRIFEPIQHHFESIVVIANEVGIHPFTNLKFLPYHTKTKALEHIRSMQYPNVIFYGDFFMTSFFIEAKVPYYFTYHDNWPEQGELSERDEQQSLFYTPIYKRIIKNAQWTVTVSRFKYNFVQSISQKSSIIRNGVNCAVTKKTVLAIHKNKQVKVIMVGNIDKRKYEYAIGVFEEIQKRNIDQSFEIHIYGKQHDLELVSKLEKFQFVRLKGFSSDINFDKYNLMLHTSKMENLSIAVCEALANFTPVVCFDVGGLSEVIIHGENGILVSPGKVTKMANWFIDCITKKQTFCFENQNLSDFNWNKAAKQYAQILPLSY